ncbi:hypothetical protein [Absidia glauca]|uniref:Uncharacterized protein n=1 Tax=Absidia glauca TaxID=4829 RepID=A0A168PFT1_ABSGL|nr:hypothetical protein [Absidia glauca]
MEFKRLFNRVHDKVSNTDSWSSSSTTQHHHERQRPLKGRIVGTTPLSKWRGKWGDVSRSRLFSSSSSNKSNDSGPLQDPCEPTITITRTTPRPRPHSTIIAGSSEAIFDQQQPISYTPAPVRLTHEQHHQIQRKRLSVPYVVDHLRSPYDTPCSSHPSDTYNDAGSFYNIPIDSLPPPKRRVTWYIPQRQQMEHNDSMDDDTTDSSLGQDSTISTSTSLSSTSLTGLASSKEDPPALDPIFISETSHKGSNDHLQDNAVHHQLVTLHVSNTMMEMREYQLERQMVKTRMENQRLGQQMAAMTDGTLATQLLEEENERLEKQIQQLQQQQRLIRSNLTTGDSCWRDEQEALRHTRAQLGLVEYLEGEPDIMAALNRFKKLLASSC